MDRKVAIVTGGGQGIGKATAQELLQAGWAVVLAEADHAAGAATEGEYRDLGPVRFVAADVSDEASVQAMIRATVEAFGRLDLLVNNAGRFDHTPLESLTLETWSRILGTNLTGAFLCAKHAAAHLRRTRGNIVNIASTRALQSEPDTEAYAASKGGLVALTHALAASLGPEVRVHCISPGWIDVRAWEHGAHDVEPLSLEDHAQHPAGRVGTPEDVARLIRFLADPANGFLTGENLVLDGGMTRKMIYV